MDGEQTGGAAREEYDRAHRVSPARIEGSTP